MTSEQRRVVLTLGFCGLVSAADNWFVSPALPAIAQTLAVAPSVVAVILTGCFAAGIISVSQSLVGEMVS